MSLLRPHLSPARYLGLILILGLGAILAAYALFFNPNARGPEVSSGEVRARFIYPNAPQKAQPSIEVPLAPKPDPRSSAPPSAEIESAPYTLIRASEAKAKSRRPASPPKKPAGQTKARP